MANAVTGIAHHLWIGQDDESTRDVWLDIAPTGAFQEEVWQRMVWLDKPSGRIALGDWRYSRCQDEPFDDAENAPPPAVQAEFDRLRPEVERLARTAPVAPPARTTEQIQMTAAGFATHWKSGNWTFVIEEIGREPVRIAMLITAMLTTLLTPVEHAALIARLTATQ